MARMILVSFGSVGDINPFVGLGVALRKRGHDVVVVANRYYERVIRDEGLGYAPMGTPEQYEETLRDREFWSTDRGFAALAKFALMQTEEGVESIVSAHKPGETVVITGRFAFAGLIAAEMLGAPTATLLLNLTALRSLHSPPRLATMNGAPPADLRPTFDAIERRTNQLLGEPLDAFRIKRGLSPFSNFKSWWDSSNVMLAAWPEWLYGRQPDWPANVAQTGFIEYDGPPDRSAGDWDGAWNQAPVVFTAGTAMAHGGDFFASSIAACKLLGRPGLLLAKFSEQIPKELPDYVRHLSYAPLAQLLPRTAAIVHHGGVGTTARALRAGIPQVFVPIAHDQFENATRVERLGAGVLLDSGANEPELLAAAVANVLSSTDMRQAARRCADRLASEQGIEAACNRIEEIGRGTAHATGHS